MIKWMRGDFWESAESVDALVNTVNTEGVMGKGLALEFKRRYPENFKAYQRACEQGELQVGKVFVFETGQLLPRLIINFPTKKHWRSKSKIEYIEQGLQDLVEVIQRAGIKSIALPPLGCGLGGLKWQQVKPLIEHYLEPLQGVEVLVYEPSVVPPTVQEAAFLNLVAQYAEIYGFLTKDEMAPIAQIAGVLNKPPRKKRSKKSTPTQAKPASLNSLINSLLQKRLLAEYKQDKQKLYAVPLNAQSLIDETLKQSAEWLEYTNKLADQIVHLDSLDSLDLFNQLYNLKRNPNTQPYLEGVWQILEQVPPPPPAQSKAKANNR